MLVRARRTVWLLLVSSWLSVAASAVVIHPNPLLGSPDPEQPPPSADDPGFHHFGSFGVGGAIFLGRDSSYRAWILTARHLGNPGEFELDGVVYPTDLSAEFLNPNGSTADLRAWRLVGNPPLPALDAIASATPATAEEVTLLLRGRKEAALTCWDALWNTTACTGAAHSGYNWGSERPRRWATNRISPDSAAIDAFKEEFEINEEVFVTRFDEQGTVLEAQSASGDSGGVAFVRDGSGFALAGVALYIGAIPSDPNRPSQISVFEDDITLYADLSHYRQQILDGTGVLLPEPRGGLGVGLGLLCWLAFRRRKNP